ncbi:hypothetical protein [Vibrio metoecus]|uniref:hypothetical protein n=1 Tax=Vibrio metoecus TaxID=1481663 RepID=UPI000BA92E9D|nr:hypothetical protein [Vibrio metoecus]EGQ9322077.1 hypothetical protein [Vibrio cholerae]EIX4876094.1 hypothetical protein [Vibrio vulnificus]EGQ9441076.1 hypothetical protein [Vibrio cholerae]EGQ9647818.1 hypothetical protein [Vibrio cholerae]EJL6641065.1 hypothetical protein [Vibrio cholerae]
MQVISNSIVLNLSKRMGLLVLELDDCTSWSMIDSPYGSVIGSNAKVLRDGRNHYIQFDGSSEKFAADEM